MGYCSLKTWVVTFGKCRFVYYTAYHAEQFARALRLNGTPHIMEGPCSE